MLLIQTRGNIPAVDFARARRSLSLTHAQLSGAPRSNAFVCNFVSRGRYLSLVSHYMQLFQRVIRKHSGKRARYLIYGKRRDFLVQRMA